MMITENDVFYYSDGYDFIQGYIDKSILSISASMEHTEALWLWRVCVASLVLDNNCDWLLNMYARGTYHISCDVYKNEDKTAFVKGILEKIMNLKRQSAARRIQKCWRESISNPYYYMCRKRLLQEFTELM